MLIPIGKAREIKDKPIPKFPQKSWLLVYLYKGDEVFASNRWNWWLECLLEQRIIGNIPQVEFHSHDSHSGGQRDHYSY